MVNYLKVEGHKDLVRDKQTGVVLNINKKETLLAIERKRIRKEKEKELKSMKEDVDTLKSDMVEIKSLLNKIAERL
tara:strand:- start:191 stop:418 length:228 start_codon:yes stop_codon:yes gene_type:complete